MTRHGARARPSGRAALLAALALAAAVGCDRGERPAGDAAAGAVAERTQPARTPRVLGDVLAVDAPFRLGDHRPVDDGRTQRSPHAEELAGACHACHADVVREWAASQHALAWVDEHFQASLEPLRNPQACHGCHVPEPLHGDGHRFGAQPYARAADAEPWHFGVSCATCHLAADGATWLGPVADPQAPHPAAQGESFVGIGSNRLCIDCHRRNVGPVLGIAQEYERSPLAAAGVRCIDCHFAPVERATAAGAPVRRGRSHELLGPRDPLFLAQAFAPRAEGAGDVTRIVVANRAGHRVPGLVGRRLHFEARIEAPAGVDARVAWTIDHDAPLAIGEERAFELAARAERVRLVARHEAPGLAEPVPFLDVILEVAR